MGRIGDGKLFARCILLIASGFCNNVHADWVHDAALATGDSCLNEGGYTDSDRDTLPDAMEGTGDADLDGIPNHLDTDSDNDGVPDREEYGFSLSNYFDISLDPEHPLADIDADGVIKRLDVDDNDPAVACILSYVEPDDHNGNQVPDFLEPYDPIVTQNSGPCQWEIWIDGPDFPELLFVIGSVDSDADLIADSIETSADTDGDGIPNFLDSDSDNDGIPDRMESGIPWPLNSPDADGDGLPGIFDKTDSDKDSLCTEPVRAPADRNANGTPDFLEPTTGPDTATDSICVGGGYADTDMDGIPDVQETDDDADGDGLPNYMDLDSDGDLIPDEQELRPGYIQGYEYRAIDDQDNDGIGADYDTDNNNFNIVCWIEQAQLSDHDGDGLWDFLDDDSDDDGVLDTVEVSYGGVYSLDTDGDGLSDAQEIALGSLPGSADSDGGGIADAWELFHGSDPLDPADDLTIPQDADQDNDGIPDAMETDNNTSTDQDSDGIPDTHEVGFAAEDSNGDGIIDDLTDDNFDGIPDVVGVLTSFPDFDQDGIPDLRDRDSDQDGLLDLHESGWRQMTSLAPDSQDSDADGDGFPNHLDLDSDNDGISDFTESGERSIPVYSSQYWPICGEWGGAVTEGTLNEYLPYQVTDTDQNGRVDRMDDLNQNGIPDIAEVTNRPGSPDMDGDLIFDTADMDHAKRRIEPTCQYSFNVGTLSNVGSHVADRFRALVDENGNGVEADFDPDDNADGALDGFERTPTLPDFDGDGIPAVFDDDDQPPVEQPSGADSSNENNVEGTETDGGNDSDTGEIEGAEIDAPTSENTNQVSLVEETEGTTSIPATPEQNPEAAAAIPENIPASTPSSANNQSGGGGGMASLLPMIMFFAFLCRVRRNPVCRYFKTMTSPPAVLP